MNIGREVNSLDELNSKSKRSQKSAKKVAKVSYVLPLYTLNKSFTIGVKLVSGKNTREHWSIKSKRNQEIKEQVELFMCYVFQPLEKLRSENKLVVTITRYGIRKMDDDNLSNSAYAVRDCVAKCLRIDDGDPRIEWKYEQQIGREYGCKVEIQSK